MPAVGQHAFWYVAVTKSKLGVTLGPVAFARPAKRQAPISNDDSHQYRTKAASTAGRAMAMRATEKRFGETARPRAAENNHAKNPSATTYSGGPNASSRNQRGKERGIAGQNANANNAATKSQMAATASRRPRLPWFITLSPDLCVHPSVTAGRALPSTSISEGLGATLPVGLSANVATTTIACSQGLEHTMESA